MTVVLCGGSALPISRQITDMVAFIAIKWLLGYIVGHRFTPFAIYRIAFGAALLLLVPAGG